MDTVILRKSYSYDVQYPVEARSRKRRSIGRRFNRQVTSSTLEDHLDNIKSFAAKAGEAFSNPHEAIKEGVSKMSSHAQDLRDRIEKMVRSSDFSTDSAKERVEKIIAALHPDKIKEHITKLTDKIDTSEIKDRFAKFASSIDASAIKDSISKIADPIIGHASNMVQNPDEFFKGFKENFAVPSSRSKRSVDSETEEASGDNDQDYESDDSDDNEEINEKRYPMLKVKDRQMPCECETIKNLQKLSRTRVELRSPESLQYVPELDIGDAVVQPQYVEYINGQPVTYEPRKSAANEEKSASDVREGPAARVVFDRYGHRYFENNGNLRLVTPQYQEAVVGAQPNFAGLADILNQNREVLDELNPMLEPNRMVPQPTEIAERGIDLVRDMIHPNRDMFRENREMVRQNRDMVRQIRDNAKAELKKKKKFAEKKSQVKAEDDSKIELNEAPKSIYQMFPMNVDDNEGKLLVRVYSAKDSKDGQLPSDADHTGEKRPSPVPTIQKISRGDKDFEVITFDHASDNSNEEVQQIYQLYYNDSEQNDEKQ